ncbi:hypothetical protein EDB80DRAFT_696732 [Ilyonectria destructans]|nr:hypothetical protein EDB80DRAFT_696732 [Ilyonectria destructans]
MSSRMHASPKPDDCHGVLNTMTGRHHSSSSIHVCSMAGCEASCSSWDEDLSMESLDTSIDTQKTDKDNIEHMDGRTGTAPSQITELSRGAPQTTTVPHPLPQNQDAVCITTSTARGRCITATQDFPSRHQIIVEKPAISCVHWRQRRGKKTIGDEWDKLTPTAQHKLQKTFPKLRGIPNFTYPDGKGRKQLKKFVEEYAFWDSQSTHAHVYPLASHINHACSTHQRTAVDRLGTSQPHYCYACKRC